MNDLTNEKRMSVKEIAAATGAAERTVQDTAMRLNAGVRVKGDGPGRPALSFDKTSAALISHELKKDVKSKVNSSIMTREEENAHIMRAMQMLMDRTTEAEVKQKHLEIELDESKSWYTVKKMQSIGYFKGVDPRRLWKKVWTWSAKNDYQIKEIPDANYGTVNSYHRDAWEEAYGIIID